MNVSHPHAPNSEFFEHGRRIEAESVADLLQGLTGGVILHCFNNLRCTHALRSLLDSSSREMMRDGGAVDTQLIGYPHDRLATEIR